MERILNVLGLMICFSVLKDYIADKSYDRKKDGKPDSTPLMLLYLILSFITAPVGLYLTWHDKIMENHFRDDYHKSHQGYYDLMERKQRDLESEIENLKEIIEDERFSIHAEERLQGWKDGYRAGFYAGFDFCFEENNLPKDKYWKLKNLGLSHVNYEIKAKERAVRSEDDLI